MGALRMMFKWFCQAWAAGQQGSLGPDTHKWESKMETLRLLSSACHST
ncbi:MAG: hypothetical protein KBE04_00230 [Phycisphaerae bacterium]|nr:hypothetical protein [Phycisphaerae bacterium]